MCVEKSSDQLAFEKAQRGKSARYSLLMFSLLLLLLILNNLANIYQLIKLANPALLSQCALLILLISWALSRHYCNYVNRANIFDTTKSKPATRSHIASLQLKKTLHRKIDKSHNNHK